MPTIHNLMTLRRTARFIGSLYFPVSLLDRDNPAAKPIIQHNKDLEAHARQCAKSARTIASILRQGSNTYFRTRTKSSHPLSRTRSTPK